MLVCEREKKQWEIERDQKREREERKREEERKKERERERVRKRERKSERKRKNEEINKELSRGKRESKIERESMFKGVIENPKQLFQFKVSQITFVCVFYLKVLLSLEKLPQTHNYFLKKIIFEKS